MDSRANSEVAIIPRLGPHQELSRSWKTITEMIRDRGEDASRLESMSADDLIHIAGGRPIFYVDDSVSGYRVIYDMSSNFKMANIKKMIMIGKEKDREKGKEKDKEKVREREREGGEKINGHDQGTIPLGAPDDDGGGGGGGIRAYIVVARRWGGSGATTTTPSSAEKINALGQDVQFFELRRLICNLSRHYLVPRHEPIRDEQEIGVILKRLMINSRFQLPIIYDKDPMAQYLALKHGQLVRVVRESPTSGLHIVYRCCCTRPE